MIIASSLPLLATFYCQKQPFIKSKQRGLFLLPQNWNEGPGGLIICPFCHASKMFNRVEDIILEILNIESRIRIYHVNYIKWFILRCLKITEKVSFNIASEASYVYILSGQKFLRNATNGSFWRFFYVCGQTVLPDRSI